MTDPRVDCAAQVERAQQVFDANKRRVLAGETFRSQKPSTWQPGKSPSDYGNRSHGAR